MVLSLRPTGVVDRGEQGHQGHGGGHGRHSRQGNDRPSYPQTPLAPLACDCPACHPRAIASKLVVATGADVHLPTMGGSGSSLRRAPHGRPAALVLVETLDTLEDPRVDRTKLHNLTDILVLSVLAVICGADSFVAIALFGQFNEAWLRTFLSTSHGHIIR